MVLKIAGGANSRRSREKTDGKIANPQPLSDKPGLGVRMAAAKLLAAVVDRHTPLDGLTDARGGNPAYLVLEDRDRMLVRAIVNTALRFRGTIEAIVSARLQRPLPDKAHTLGHILHIGAAQILFLEVPDSAAVDLAVSHARADTRTARFAGLVNGVLREIVRRKDRALPRALAEAQDAPEWLIRRLEEVYGSSRSKAILELHRREAAMDFSVKSDPEGWAERLGGIVLPGGTVRVARPSAPIFELPGFAQGDWWVQDAAASLPARLLGDVSGLRVADLCAAPGGKTAQLVLAGANVTAVEKSANRAARLKENLSRLRLEAAIVNADLFDLEKSADFDAVLLDAPCSSTGTIRRHPDIAWTKTPDDVAKLAELQYRMLDHAVGLVRPGGRIVFSNCSLDPAEGEQVAQRLQMQKQEAVLEPIRAAEIPGIETFVTKDGYLRTTPEGLDHLPPELSGMDGFFAARFRRRD